MSEVLNIAYSIIGALGLTLIYRVFCYIFDDTTEMQKQIQYYEESTQSDTQSGSITMENTDEFELSIVYWAHVDAIIAFEQIDCVRQLIENNLGRNYKYEIIYLVPEDKPYLERGIELLHTTNKYFRALRCKRGHMQGLITASLHAKGKYIVTADHLVTEIDFIPGFTEKTLHMICPKVHYPGLFYDKYDFSRIVSISKPVAMLLFNFMHLTGFGASSELLFLARKYNISPLWSTASFGKIDYHFIECLCARVLNRAVHLMHNHRIWTHRMKLKCD